MLHNSYTSNSADPASYLAGSNSGSNYSASPSASSLSASYVPPLQPPVNLPAANAPLRDHLQAQVDGDVTIDPSAVLGLGVMVRAEPGTKIVIGAGVCVGMGTVLHAQSGEIWVGNGVSIGAGGLILGAAKLGDNCCLGTSTTVINSIVASGAVVSPGTVVQQKLNATNSEPIEADPASGQGIGCHQSLQEAIPVGGSATFNETLDETFILENFTTTTASSLPDASPEITQGTPAAPVKTDFGMVTESFTQIQTTTHEQTTQTTQIVNETIRETITEAPTGAVTVPNVAQPVNAFPIDTEKAKAHAQSQLNRFRHRLFPHSHNPSNF